LTGNYEGERAIPLFYGNKTIDRLKLDTIGMNVLLHAWLHFPFACNESYNVLQRTRPVLPLFFFSAAFIILLSGNGKYSKQNHLLLRRLYHPSFWKWKIF